MHQRVEWEIGFRRGCRRLYRVSRTIIAWIGEQWANVFASETATAPLLDWAGAELEPRVLLSGDSILHTDSHRPMVESELASISARVPTFQVVQLPLQGHTELAPADSLIADDLRGVALDRSPPDVGAPQVPYPSRLDDNFEPGTGPYVAQGIEPFRFDYFDNEFNHGGWHNGPVSAYAAGHGFDIIRAYNASRTDWSHLPSDTNWMKINGLKWTEMLLDRGYPRYRYDLLPSQEELIQIVTEESVIPSHDGYDFLMLDMEHRVPFSDSPASHTGFRNTHLAAVEAARRAGWPAVGVYAGGAAVQPFPRTWFGLEDADVNAPKIQTAWQQYNRELVEAVDVVLPSVYAFYWDKGNVAYALANIDLNMQVLHDMAQPKPVRPYFITRLTGGGGGWRWWRDVTMWDEDLRAMTTMSFFTGIDGIVSWDSSGKGDHHRTENEIEATNTVQVATTFQAVPEGDTGRWPARLMQRYDALYVRDVGDAGGDDDVVRYQFIEQGLRAKNYGILPSIDLIAEWQFEDDVNDSIRANPADLSGGSFQEGRRGRALSFDGDDALDVHVNPSLSVEAESMELTNYVRHDNTDASGGVFISRDGASDGTSGTAETTFSGPTGHYNITVSYFNEGDDDSRFELSVNRGRIDRWTAWGVDSNSNVPDARSLRHRTISDVLLHTGDTIKMVGQEEEATSAAVDKIDFVPTLRFTYDDTFTTSAWIKLPSQPAAQDQVILGHTGSDGAGWQLRVTPDNKISFMLVEDESTYKGAVTEVPLPGDQWVHVVAVWPSNKQPTLYINGKKDAVTVPGSRIGRIEFAQDGGITIAAGGAAAGSFEGGLDQLRFYKRDLVKAEAVGLFEEGLYPVYRASSSALAEMLRPKSEGVAAQIEGLALVRPFEYLLKHGTVQIDVDARTQFDADPDPSVRVAAPIVRRVSLGPYHVIATYDPNAGSEGYTPATIVLEDFAGNPELNLSLPADGQTRIFVVHLEQALLKGDVDGNGLVDNLDLTPFINALKIGGSVEDQTQVSAFLTLVPGGVFAAADTNIDGLVDNLDITGFIEHLTEEMAGEPTQESNLTSVLASARFLAADHHVLKHQPVHLGTQETVQGFSRRVDDRLVFIERGVQDHRDAALMFEGLDQLVIARVGPLGYALESAGAVGVGHGGDP